MFLSCIQDNEFVEQTASNTDFEDPESTKIQRFELLRNELVELEERVQRSADQSENEELFKVCATGYPIPRMNKKFDGQ